MDLPSVINAKLVGLANKDHWSQTFVGENFFAAFEVVNENAFISGKKFLDKLSTINSDYPDNLIELKIFLETNTKDIQNISYACGLIKNDIIYLVCKNAFIFIKRKNLSGLVLSKTATASGKITLGDILIFSGNDFFKNISANRINASLHLENPQDIAETLAPYLSSQTETCPAGLVVKIVKTNKNGFSPFFAKQIFQRLNWKNFKNKFYFKIKLAPLFIFLLFLILAISIAFGLKENQLKKTDSLISQQLELVRYQFSEGTSLVDLNPIRSRQLLKSALSLISTASALTNDKKIQNEITDLKNKIQTSLDQAMKKYDVELAVFFDLDLVKTNGVGEKMFLSGDVLFILDKTNKAIYQININTKAAKVLAAGEMLGQTMSISADINNLFVLADGIYKVNAKGLLDKVIDKDELWIDVVDISTYGANLYVLDKGALQIWKYIGGETGFSNINKYLTEEVKLPALCKQIVINGSVWIVGETEIIQYASGNKGNWQIQDFDEKFDSNIYLYTSENVKYLYLLEPIKKRVVVLDKDGIYLAQYIWSKDAEISQIAVSEKEKKILLLSRGTIYGIDIK